MTTKQRCPGVGHHQVGGGNVLQQQGLPAAMAGRPCSRLHPSPMGGGVGDVRLTHWVLFDWCQLRGGSPPWPATANNQIAMMGGPKSKNFSSGTSCHICFAVSSRRGHSFNQIKFQTLNNSSIFWFSFSFPRNTLFRCIFSFSCCIK